MASEKSEDEEFVDAFEKAGGDLYHFTSQNALKIQSYLACMQPELLFAIMRAKIKTDTRALEIFMNKLDIVEPQYLPFVKKVASTVTIENYAALEEILFLIGLLRRLNEKEAVYTFDSSQLADQTVPQIFENLLTHLCKLFNNVFATQEKTFVNFRLPTTDLTQVRAALHRALHAEISDWNRSPFDQAKMVFYFNFLETFKKGLPLELTDCVTYSTLKIIMLCQLLGFQEAVDFLSSMAAVNPERLRKFVVDLSYISSEYSSLSDVLKTYCHEKRYDELDQIVMLLGQLSLLKSRGLGEKWVFTHEKNAIQIIFGELAAIEAETRKCAERISEDSDHERKRESFIESSVSILFPRSSSLNCDLFSIPVIFLAAPHWTEENSIPRAFIEFAAQFNKANDYAQRNPDLGEQDANQEARYILNWDDFIKKHHKTLMALQRLLGVESLYTFLKSRIKTSNLAIDRLLENIADVWYERNDVLKTVAVRLGKQNDKLEDFLLLMAIINILHRDMSNFDSAMNAQWQLIIMKLNECLAQPKFNSDEVVKILSDYMIDCYKAILHVDLDPQKVMQMKFTVMEKLLVGRRRLTMTDREWQAVFDTLVASQLSREPIQNELTERIDKHNEAIRAELTQKGIFVPFAMQYPLQKEFYFSEHAGVADLVQLCRAITSALQFLAEELKKNTKKTGELNALEALVQLWITELGLDETEQEKLASIEISKVVHVIHKYYKKLEKVLSVLTSGSIAEFAIHLRNYLDQFIELQKDENKKDIFKNVNAQCYELSVEQWDKERLDTFLLGDYVSCCLATNGGQFQAMIQRAMDDGMIVHIVRDMKTGEPVSCNWLFFARDKNNPNDIYVVANFYEIRTGFGLKDKLRDRIVQELTDFTRRYALDIGAKGFLIRPLDYGHIPDKNIRSLCGDTPDKKVTIEKVGGFFEPLSYSRAAGKQARYFLLALGLDRFHDASASQNVELDVPGGFWHCRQPSKVLRLVSGPTQALRNEPFKLKRGKL